MKRTMLILTVIFTVSFSGIFSAFQQNIATAKSLDELKKEQTEIKGERSDLNDGIEAANQKISELQAEQDRILKEIDRLELSINDTNNKIVEKNSEISEVELEIAKLKEAVEELKQRIIKRNEILKGRALSFQESGGVISYIDVLLGAQGFSDFIDRVTSVATILEADRDLLNQHNADKKSLEDIQTEVEQQLASLEEKRSELQKMETNLKSQKSEQNSLVQTLKEEETQVEEAKFSLQEEEEILAKQQKAVQAMIKLEEQRLREEEEARRKAEEEAKNNGGAVVPPTTSGSFMNPAVGYLTSQFRPPHRPDHHGIDIGNRNASVPIVAAASGYVYRSYYSPSYGNVVFIRHSIDGQVYETVYAHMDSRGVAEDTFVTKGQFIGYMGNTGQSFGKHLHFEVHRGGWNMSKSNAVNPLQFVSY